jgi:hypothetical protein
VLERLATEGVKPKLLPGVYTTVLHAHKLGIRAATGIFLTAHHTCDACGMRGPGPSFASCSEFLNCPVRLCMNCIGLSAERSLLVKSIADAVSAKEVIEAMEAGAATCPEVAAAGCRRLGLEFVQRHDGRAEIFSANGLDAIVAAMRAHPQNQNVAKQAGSTLVAFCRGDATARKAVFDAVGGELQFAKIVGSAVVVNTTTQVASRIVGEKAVDSAQKAASRIFSVLNRTPSNKESQ